MTSTLKPHEIRHQRTRQAILDAARQIIAQKGINGLSLRGIARAIDYSPAGLYEYFGSKDEIVSAVAEEGHLRLRRAMAAVAETGNFVEDIRSLGVAYMRFAIENPDHFMLMFTLLPQYAMSEDEATAMMSDKSAFPILVAAAERGVKQGVFKVREGFGPLEIAFTAWSDIHGITMLRLTQLKYMSDDTLNHITSMTMQNLMRGLTAD